MYIKQTCNWAPSQWDIEVNDQKYYIRYRWGYLTIATIDEFETLKGYEEIYCEQLGDEWDGDLSQEDMLKVFYKICPVDGAV